MPEKLKVHDLENAIRRSTNPLFTLTRVSHGFFRWGEADVISISKSGYITEYEIKMSIADLKKDREKEKWKNEPLWWDKNYPGNFNSFLEKIKFYYVVVPEYLHVQAIKHLPYENAGLMYVYDGGHNRGYIRYVKKATASKVAKPVTVHDWRTLAFLAEARYWKLRAKQDWTLAKYV